MAPQIVEYEWQQPRSGNTHEGVHFLRGLSFRNGEFWTREEYQVLVEAGVNGEPSASIADTLARTPGSINARARHMLSEDHKRDGRKSWWETLLAVLEEEPDYPWAYVLRSKGQPVLSYQDIRDLSKLPRRDAESTATAMRLTGLPEKEAEEQVTRFGIPASDTLRVKNLLETTDHLPTRAHGNDAGLDLRYAGSEPIDITAQENATLPTGVAIAIPRGHVGLICPRSGLAAKHGITVVNAPGIIDSGYTGELRVALGAIGATSGTTINPGDRIAQLVITPITTPAVVIVDNLDRTTRGEGGFGSTGNQ